MTAQPSGMARSFFTSTLVSSSLGNFTWLIACSREKLDRQIINSSSLPCLDLSFITFFILLP